MGWVIGDKLPFAAGASANVSTAPPEIRQYLRHFRWFSNTPNNVRGFHHCRHWVKTDSQVKDYILGSQGVANVSGNAISGKNKWRYR